MAASKAQREAVKKWLASLPEKERNAFKGSARAALAPRSKRDQYDEPRDTNKDDPLDLTDPDGDDAPPDAA